MCAWPGAACVCVCPCGQGGPTRSAKKAQPLCDVITRWCPPSSVTHRHTRKPWATPPGGLRKNVAACRPAGLQLCGQQVGMRFTLPEDYPESAASLQPECAGPRCAGRQQRGAARSAGRRGESGASWVLGAQLRPAGAPSGRTCILTLDATRACFACGRPSSLSPTPPLPGRAPPVRKRSGRRRPRPAAGCWGERSA